MLTILRSLLWGREARDGIATPDGVSFTLTENDPVAIQHGGQSRGPRRRPAAATSYSYLQPISHPSVSATALPQGVSSRISVGAVSASGAGLATPYGQGITLLSHTPLAIGTVDISDEDLIFLLSAA